MILYFALLTGCSTVSKSVYVKPVVPDMPAKPSYYDVSWGKGAYCMDEHNAKNLLKNRELEKDYIAQLEAIITGMK